MPSPDRSCGAPEGPSCGVDDYHATMQHLMGIDRKDPTGPLRRPRLPPD
jgi:hypothetical protein